MAIGNGFEIKIGLLVKHKSDETKLDFVNRALSFFNVHFSFFYDDISLIFSYFCKLVNIILRYISVSKTVKALVHFRVPFLIYKSIFIWMKLRPVLV